MGYADLLIWQYKSCPRAVATMELLAKGFDDEVAFFAEFPNVLNIFKATGKSLDIVGKHVGVSRRIGNFKYRKFFGFKRSPQALGFSVAGKGGGRWYRYSYPLFDVVDLNDKDYRWLILAKILKNYQNASLSNLKNFCTLMYGENVQITDNYDMTVTIKIDKALTDDFTAWAAENLDLFPRQCGVKYNVSIIEFDKKYFGFKGSSQAEAFNVGKWLRK